MNEGIERGWTPEDDENSRLEVKRAERKKAIETAQIRSNDYQGLLSVPTERISEMGADRIIALLDHRGPASESWKIGAIWTGSVEGEDFAIVPVSVEEFPDDPDKPKQWRSLLLAEAKNDSLNIRGSGVNLIPAEWHEKLISALMKEDGGDFSSITPEHFLGGDK